MLTKGEQDDDYYGSSDKAASAINARASDRGISGIRSMRAYAVGNFKILRPETYNFINQLVNLDNVVRLCLYFLKNKL